MSVHSDICLPYFLSYATDEQKQRWLPGLVSGELIAAIAMTEPGTGSDLAGISATAARKGGEYVVNGAKTFITNGINADLVITAVRTDRGERHRGLSLLVVERGTPGFERGRNLEKIGTHAQDTAELFFDDARVPAENLLGNEGEGFRLPGLEPAAGAAVDRGRRGRGCRGRDRMDGRVRARPQGLRRRRSARSRTRASSWPRCAPRSTSAQAYVDRCVEALNAGELTAEDAAGAKWWCTELQGRVVDRCLQLHGGYGYMLEYPIARAYADARVTRIYGGSNEIMKEIVGRAMKLE